MRKPRVPSLTPKISRCFIVSASLVGIIATVSCAPPPNSPPEIPNPVPNVVPKAGTWKLTPKDPSRDSVTFTMPIPAGGGLFTATTPGSRLPWSGDFKAGGVVTVSQINSFGGKKYFENYRFSVLGENRMEGYYMFESSSTENPEEPAKKSYYMYTADLATEPDTP